LFSLIKLKILSANFSTGTDSPVKDASSIFKIKLSISLKSAGIISPVSSSTISPTTSSGEGI